MKTTLMEAHVVGGQAGSLAGYGRAAVWSFAPRPSNREWLPVPKVELTRPQSLSEKRKIWAWIPKLPHVENKLLGLLLVGTCAGLVYGFWMMTQLAENWAGFQTGITRLVE